MDGCKLKLETLLRGAPIKHGPDWLSTEHVTECTQPLRDVPLEGVLTTLEARGTCQPKKKLPWEAIPKLAKGKGRHPKRAETMAQTASHGLVWLGSPNLVKPLLS